MGRGSVRERAPGRWQIRAYVGDGVWKSETVRGSRADADRRLRRILDEIDEGAHRGPNRTVTELLDAWLSAKGPSLSPSTLAMTRGHLDNYLKPKLGRIKLSKLDPSAIDLFYAELAGGGVKGQPLAPSYIRRIHGTLHLALEQAVSWGWAARNPATRATPPPARPSDKTPPDLGQVLLLLEEAERRNPQLAVYLRVAVAAGPRRGEIAGLRKSDIDFDAGAIVFRRAIVLDGIVKPYPKSRKARRISIDTDTVAALADHLEALEKRAADCGTTLDPDPWVFSHDLQADLPPRPDAFTRSFNRLRDRLGLTVRLHDLRHYHATDLLTAGVDVRTVAGRLGHASATTTLSIYAGWVPAADRAASEGVGDRLRRKNS